MKKIDFKNFKLLVSNTRSTRRFDSSTIIDISDLYDLIDLARLTSSGKNMQPLKYIPIVDKKTRNKIHKPLVWAAKLTNWTQDKNERPSAYILIVNDTSIDGFSQIDSGIAMQTIILGAKTKGYSGCILASIDKKKYKKILNLKKHLEPIFIIALGIPNEEIKIVNAIDNKTDYYRKNNIHYVPKRKLDDIIIKK